MSVALNASPFLFQTGAIKSTGHNRSISQQLTFLFQTGAIKSLSKTDIYIVLNPYSTCQVNFIFSCFKVGFQSTSNRANSLGG